MRKVRNISAKEIFSMERSFPAFHKQENLEGAMKEVLLRQYIASELEKGDD